MAEKIRVHEKALAHLTRGLYRSPASALRELVSNGWDADARVVRITTGAPAFFQLAIQDDGKGFGHDDFDDLMKGGIGNSQKRPDQVTLENDRSVIGRLGIGMLGIAQICQGFTVISKKQDGNGFKASVKLFDLIKERLDEPQSPLITEDGNLRTVDVGEYHFLPFDSDEADFGTLIVTDDLHPTFVKVFQESVSSEAYKDVPLDWSRAIKLMAGHRSLQELGDYWRLLWELSVSCPIPYASDSAVPGGVIESEQARLKRYNFKVLVDGINLFKPVSLSGNKAGYTVRRIASTALRSYGKIVKFHGYIVVQEGSQLKPDELRGILIRIKDIGIGYYDPSLLDFRDNEGPRNRWITGEIYVEEGLEDALNIDRDSFNRFHPEFRVLQVFVHSFLRKEIFPEVYKKLDARSKKKAQQRDEERQNELEAVLSTELDAPIKLRTSNSVTVDNVDIDVRAKDVVVTLPRDEQIHTKKGQRSLASAMLTIFEVSLLERTKTNQRKRFTKLLMDLLNHW